MIVPFVAFDPQLVAQAQETVQRWLSSGPTRSTSLWQEWDAILKSKSWKKVLGRSQRAAELRQASPLTPVLPAEVRAEILGKIRDLRKGIPLGADNTNEMTT